MEVTYKAVDASVSQIVSFVSDNLKKLNINDKLSYEYQLLAEEISLKLIKNAKEDADIVIDLYKHFGGIYIKLTCPGKVIHLEQEDELDFGGKIIEGFSESLRQNYSAGVNYITFASSSSESNKFLLNNVISLLLSLVVAFIMQFALSDSQVDWINANVVYPLVVIFTRCLQAVATPGAFFSLAAFIVTLRLSLDRNKKIISIVSRYLTTSIIAILIGGGLWKLYTHFGIRFHLAIEAGQQDSFMGTSFGEFLENSVIGNIIDPFLVSNPMPMLIIAVLLGFAIGNFFGPTGDAAKTGVAALDGVFCRMLGVAYNLIPYFLFFSFLRGYLESGFIYYISLLKNLLLFFPGFIGVLIIYFFQLLLSGINPFHFVKDYKEILIENWNISSNVQAFPYNMRMMYRKAHLPMTELDEYLRLGVIMNMDGNCVIVSTGILGMILSTNTKLEFIQIVLLILVIILLSVGAPNAPGSFLLSMIVLMSFVGFNSNLYGDIVVFEGFLTKIYSTLNSYGDIVTVACVAKRGANIDAK